MKKLYIEPIVSQWMDNNLPTVYAEGASWYEALSWLATKLNTLITNINEYFDEDLETIVNDILDEWKSSGYIKTILDQALETQLATVNKAIEDAQKELDKKLDSINLAGDMNIDFANDVNNFTYYKDFYLRKHTSNNEIYLIYDLDDGTHLTYTVIKDDNDDYWKLGSIFTGSLSKENQNYLTFPSLITFNGNWVGQTGNIYTNTVNDYFTAQFEGVKPYIRVWTDDRGGDFDIYIDDIFIETITTYSKSSGQKYIPINVNLDYGLHSIKGIFKGENPYATYETGVRGWISTSTTGEAIYANKALYNVIPTREKTLLNHTSNKEIAISVTTTDGYSEWFPEHANTPVAYNIEPMKVIVNNTQIDYLNLPVGYSVKANTIEIKQNVYNRLNGKNVFKFEQNYSAKQGKVNYKSKLTTLVDLRVNLFYPLMLPAQIPFPDKYQLNTSQIILNDSTERTDTYTNTYATQIAAIDSDNIVYGKVLNPIESLDIQGQNLNEVRFWNRVSSPKFYFVRNTNAQWPANTQVNLAGEFGVISLK